MGRRGQGNKAQTPLGYSHGTGVYTAIAGTGVVLVLLRGNTWVGKRPHADTVGVSTEVRWQLCEQGFVQSHGNMEGHT